MNFENFETEILNKYENRELTKSEIEDICFKAINNKIIDHSDIDISNIRNITTKDLLSHIKKCRSSFLTKSIDLQENDLISEKYHTPLSVKYDITKSPFYKQKMNLENMEYNYDEDNYKSNDNKSAFIRKPIPENMNKLINDQVSNNYTEKLKFESPLISKHSNIENPFINKTPFVSETPFVSGNEFESFCDDLRNKTTEIKKSTEVKQISDKEKRKIIDDTIDKFIRIKCKGSRSSGCYLTKTVFVICLGIFLYFGYTNKPI